jgi:hypothetical protein
MARIDKKTYELTEAEQRDLVTLIQQGRPLPDKYRFILFEDKREVELVWNGKTRDVCTTVLPFQTLEHIDEPRSETKVQDELFDSRGRQLGGWTNKLIWGDNKLILSSLKAGALRQQIEDAGGSTSTRPLMWAPISAWTSRSAERPSTKRPACWSTLPTAIRGGGARTASLRCCMSG